MPLLYFVTLIKSPATHLRVRTQSLAITGSDHMPSNLNPAGLMFLSELAAAIKRPWAASLQCKLQSV